MTTIFISRLYVPEHIKAFYFQNQELHAEYARLIKSVVLARLERVGGKKEYKPGPTKYSKYIEIRHPLEVDGEYNTRRVELGEEFEKHLRQTLVMAFKRNLFHFVEAYRWAGFKEKSAIAKFMRENNLMGLRDFHEQHCLDYYREFKKKYQSITKYRKVE